ncbi:MAG: HPr family phosphocarrier protein [Gammaproteobacteria bacterium]|nr:HPr family phosphocarrier protein [Gammaproteobacteria bacterium]
MIRDELTIINKLGLHARAAAKFVHLASSFQSRVKLITDGTEVNGKSIMGIMMLAAAQGTRVTVEVDGADEAQAAKALVALVAERFGEPE